MHDLRFIESRRIRIPSFPINSLFTYSSTPDLALAGSFKNHPISNEKLVSRRPSRNFRPGMIACVPGIQISGFHPKSKFRYFLASEPIAYSPSIKNLRIIRSKRESNPFKPLAGSVRISLQPRLGVEFKHGATLFFFFTYSFAY